MSRSRKVTWSLAIALPAATVGTWWTLQDHTNSAAISQTQPQQRKAFSILRSSPERLSPVMRANVVTTSRRQALGLDPRLSQRVDTRAGRAVWVVPGDGSVCLFHDRTGAHICKATYEAIGQGVTLVIFQPPEQPVTEPKRYLLLGVVPDGVARVQVRSRASAATVPVRDNVYSLRMGSPPRATILRRH